MWYNDSRLQLKGTEGGWKISKSLKAEEDVAVEGRLGQTVPLKSSWKAFPS